MDLILIAADYLRSTQRVRVLPVQALQVLSSCHEVVALTVQARGNVLRR